MAIASVRCVAVATAAALLMISAPAARAQSVEAEALFRDGKRLIKEGKLAEGCDKLEASDRLESSVGTELNLGDCREKNKQLASAWAAFLKAASNAKKAGNDKDREKEARSRAAKLESRLSYLTISVPEASKVDGLTISRNGVAIDAALWNTGVPVDEGTYEITGQAPGHEAWSTKVTLTGEGAKESVEVPRFKAIEDLVPHEDPDGGKLPPGGGDGAKLPPPDEDPVSTRDTPGMFTMQRKIAVGVGVVGLVGIAGSVVFGLKAKDLQSQADELCPESACGDPMAISLNEDAQSAALKSNIFLGVGIAGVAGAVVLWFLGGPDAPAEDGDEVSFVPVVSSDQVGVSVGGNW